MRYLLDTSVCIPLINGKDSALTDKFLSLAKADLVICSVVKAELLYGAQKSRNRLGNERRLGLFFSEIQSLSFDGESAVHYGGLRAVLEQAGTTVGANDLMIAAVALQHRQILVTRNHREFSRIPSLRVEAW